MSARRTALAVACLLILGVVQAAPSRSAAPADAWHLDDSFGPDHNGEVVTDFGSTFDEIFGMALQSDGKIVVAGQVDTNGPTGSDFGLARYEPDGTLDTTFGTGGKVTTDFNGKNDSPRSVAIYPDNLVDGGKILVVGQANDPNSLAPRFAIARYTANGQLDTSFGTGGKVIFDVPYSQASSAGAVAIYPSGSTLAGRAVVAGWGATAFGHAIVLAEYDRLGAPATDFGSSGYLYPSAGGQNEEAHGVAIDPANDQIVVAGADGGLAEVVRVKPDGSPDSTFGPKYDATYRSQCFNGGWGVAIDHVGEILVAGSDHGGDMGVMRLLTNGVPDTNFGKTICGEGVATTHFMGSDGHAWPSTARAVLRDASGRIILVGYAAQSGDGSQITDLVSFAAARFSFLGAPDDTFGNDSVTPGDHNGIVAGFAYGYDAALAGALQTDGDIVAAGGTNQDQGTQQIDFGLARFTGSGGSAEGFLAQMRDLPNVMLRASPEKFLLSWKAIKPPSRTVRFDVRKKLAHFNQKDFGKWEPIVTGTAEKQKEVAITPGNAFCVEVRAHSGGFTTPWSTPKCSTTPLDDRNFSRRGRWNELPAPAYYASTALGTGDKGASLHVVPVWAKAFSLLAPKCDGCGSVEVIVDGNRPGRLISLQGPRDEPLVLIPVAKFSKLGEHEIEIEAVKIGRRGVYIDGFAALRP